MTAPKTTTTRRPATAKAPTDRLPKAEKPQVEEIDGGRRVTYDGLTVTIRTERLENWAFARSLRDAEKGSEFAMVDSVELLFGDEFSQIEDHYRGNTGLVPIQKVIHFFRSVLSAASPNS